MKCSLKINNGSPNRPKQGQRKERCHVEVEQGAQGAGRDRDGSGDDEDGALSAANQEDRQQGGGPGASGPPLRPRVDPPQRMKRNG